MSTSTSQVCIPEELRIRVPNYDDLRRKVLELFVQSVVIPRGIRKQGRERARVFRYMLKCERVFQYLASEISRIARLPKTATLHPFYAELITLASDGRYDTVVDRASKSVKILTKLWREYRSRILSAYTGAEAKELAREFIGRALSVAKRSLRDVEYVHKAIQILRKTPCIDVEAPTMIIAGMPQVGKSTLVSRISTAKPEVAPYPFTTKHIILGHAELGPIKIQVVDTPGILDRPVEEMNEIERRAVAALKHLKAVTVFLLDPSRDSYYKFEQQVSVLRSVAQFIGRDKLIVVFNKIDRVDDSRKAECRKIVESMGFSVDLEISALLGYGIDRVLQLVIEKMEQLYNIKLPKAL